jgi:hypothetical protein
MGSADGDDAGRPGARRRTLRPAQLLGVLHRHGVEFVVIGGYALAPHGYVRATKDIDIVPSPDGDNLARLAEALHALDAHVDIGDLDPAELGLDLDTAGLAAGGNWVLRTRFGRLDVMQDIPGLRSYRELRDGAIEVAGTLYAGFDELIRMKAASGRDEDLRDIAALHAARTDN